MHRPEATLMASRNALPSDFTRIIQLIEDGTINTEPWITHRTTFDTVIDERSPAEFAEDHVPDAINLPVLDNDLIVGVLDIRQINQFLQIQQKLN